MLPSNMSRVRVESVRISSVERPGWHCVPGCVPEVGARVWCIEGPAQVMRVLTRLSDGGRLLELQLPERPKVPFFAASSNVLVRED